MKFELEKTDVDATYLRLVEEPKGAISTKAYFAEMVIIDRDSEDNIVGVEFIKLSEDK